MVKPRLLRIVLTMVEATSIPLMVMALIYLLTGYEMLTSRLKLIPKARAIHVNEVLRVVFVALVLIHGYAGLILLCERIFRSKTLKLATELFITAGLLVVTVLVLAYELAVRFR